MNFSGSANPFSPAGMVIKMGFTSTYKSYVKANHKGNSFGSDLKTIAGVEPILSFLYKNWWNVKLDGLERLPHEGPALITGNTGGVLPWPGLMLMYALMAAKAYPRRLNILAELNWIKDERIYQFACALGFVPWSADNAKRLFAEGELVIIFPEGLQGAVKPFSERYRVRDFDWTKFLPAIEENVPIYSLATIGCDEVFPVLANLDWLAKFLDLPAFPVSPFMPFLPFPANLISLPSRWKMRVLKKQSYTGGQSRNENYETAMALARNVEGEVQAELNRILRARSKSL